MVNYEKFEDWFDEVENYGGRFERFYEELHNAKDSAHLADIATKWLRTAFEMGKQSQDKAL
jgi:hypothetical protein